jgi:hypothetical protein
MMIKRLLVGAGAAGDDLAELPAGIRTLLGADEPMLAFREAIAGFEPDHILVALRPDERSGWQESGLVDALVDTSDVPVTAFKLR